MNDSGAKMSVISDILAGQGAGSSATLIGPSESDGEVFEPGDSGGEALEPYAALKGVPEPGSLYGTTDQRSTTHIGI